MTQVSLDKYLEKCCDDIIERCTGCQMVFFGCENEFGLRARTFSEVMAEAMGIPLQPDKMKQFRDLGSPSLILEAAREEIDAGIYSEEEVSAVLPFLFRGDES